MSLMWAPTGIQAGQDWACTLTLTDPDTGQPRPVFRCFAEIGQSADRVTFRRLVRFDDSVTPGTGNAYPTGSPSNIVSLFLGGQDSEELPSTDEAYLEVWVIPPVGEMYCIIAATSIPIRAKAADLT